MAAGDDVAASEGLAAAVATLSEASPGRPRLEAYENLLRALTEGRLLALLWQGAPGSPEAQYGNMEVAGYGYVPCMTSPEQLAASGWNRAHETAHGRELAAVLYRSRWGVWLDPHAPGGGVGIPWADLRRVALGLDRLPAGPLEIAIPTLPSAEPFYTALGHAARDLPAVHALRRAWVAPALGEPYLAIGVELDDPSSTHSATAARTLLRHAVDTAPPGCRVALLAAPDEDDPVALWMTAGPAPFYLRA